MRTRISWAVWCMSFRGAEGPLSLRRDVAKMKTGDDDQRQK